MKRFFISSAFFACLVTALVSFYIVANPVRALAAGSEATCADGSTVSCSSAGGSCFATDSTSSQTGYCICTKDGAQSDFDYCEDGEMLVY